MVMFVDDLFEGGGAMPYDAGNLVLTSLLAIIPRDELAKLLCTVLLKMGT
jgi:hypothetical protein